jgi:Ribonuclease G/E
MMNYQLCPKCNGQGHVSKPSYVPGDVISWVDSQTSHRCDVRNGEKIIRTPHNNKSHYMYEAAQ